MVPIARWIEYGPDGQQIVRPVARVVVAVFKQAEGRWYWQVVVVLSDTTDPAQMYRRMEGIEARRVDAIRAARTFLFDAFGGVPSGTLLRIERGEERAFPSDPSRPFQGNPPFDAAGLHGWIFSHGANAWKWIQPPEDPPGPPPCI